MAEFEVRRVQTVVFRCIIEAEDWEAAEDAACQLTDEEIVELSGQPRPYPEDETECEEVL